MEEAESVVRKERLTFVIWAADAISEVLFVEEAESVAKRQWLNADIGIGVYSLTDTNR